MKIYLKMRVGMQMVKQRVGTNECGACTVAMLTEHTLEEILAVVPKPEMPDYFWLNLMQAKGFVVSDVRDDPNFDRTFAWDGMFNGHLKLPLGSRYYCSIRCPAGVHAVAIDESGLLFDPSPTAPPPGACSLEQLLRLNHERLGAITIGCFRVSPEK
jgi:hypothetical protein